MLLCCQESFELGKNCGPSEVFQTSSQSFGAYSSACCCSPVQQTHSRAAFQSDYCHVSLVSPVLLLFQPELLLLASTWLVERSSCLTRLLQRIALHNCQPLFAASFLSQLAMTRLKSRLCSMCTHKHHSHCFHQ